jgi:methylmalonyl-CoA mutase
METMYQRSKIQEESLYYETLKHNGELPIMGVNTFLSSAGSKTVTPQEVIRATVEEKAYQLSMLKELHKTYELEAEHALHNLQSRARHGENVFEVLMQATKFCSIGQITRSLFDVGGQYRRNM